MAQIIKARVWQKVDTEANWNANPLILGAGEQAFVVNSAGLPINFKVGDGTKRFSQLSWSIQYAGGQYIQLVGNVLPAPSVDAGYSLVGPGTYTFSGQPNIVAPEGRLSQLLWDGTSWSLVDMGELPMPDISDLVTKEEFEPIESSFTPSVNLINRLTLIGASWSSITGAENPNVNRVATPKISLKPNTDYVIKGLAFIPSGGALGVFFNETGDHLPALNINEISPERELAFTTGAEVAYGAFNLANVIDAGLDPSNSSVAFTVMLAESNDINIPYQPYGALLSIDKITPEAASEEDLNTLTGVVSNTSEEVSQMKKVFDEVSKDYDVFYKFGQGGVSSYAIGQTFHIVNDGDYFEIVARTNATNFNNTLGLTGVAGGLGTNIFGFYPSGSIRFRERGESTQPWNIFSTPLINFEDFLTIRLTVESGSYVLTVNGDVMPDTHPVVNGIRINSLGNTYGTNAFIGDIKSIRVHKEGMPEYYQDYLAGEGSVNVEEVISKIPSEDSSYPDFFYEVIPTGASGGFPKFIFYTKRKGARKTYVGHEISRFVQTGELEYADYYRNTGAWNYVYNGETMTRLSTRALIGVENEFTFLVPGKVDHTGGVHGDEQTVSAVFEADGKELDPDTAVGLTACEYLRYHVVSTMHETAEGDPPVVDPTHAVVAEHIKTVVFGNGGYRIVNTLKGLKTPHLDITRAYTGIVCNAKAQAEEGYSEVSEKESFLWTGSQEVKQSSPVSRETYYQNEATGLGSYITSRVVYPSQMDNDCSHFINVREQDSKYYRHTPSLQLQHNEYLILECLFECLGGE